MASTVYGWHKIEDLMIGTDFTSCADATCQELDGMQSSCQYERPLGRIDRGGGRGLGIHERIDKEKMRCKRFSSIQMDDFMVTTMDIIEGNDKIRKYFACAGSTYMNKVKIEGVQRPTMEMQ